MTSGETDEGLTREQARAQRRALVEAEATGASRRKRLQILGSVIVVVVVVIVVVLVATGGKGKSGLTTPPKKTKSRRRSPRCSAASRSQATLWASRRRR